jgi:hypothetical protein
VLTAKWEAMKKTERYELPEEARGAGEILAYREERLLFMPSNGERVYDLRSKAVFDRKLWARMKKAREIARRRARRADQWLAEEGGAFRVSNLAVRREDKRVTWAPVFVVRGRPALAGEAVPRDPASGERSVQARGRARRGGAQRA